MDSGNGNGGDGDSGSPTGPDGTDVQLGDNVAGDACKSNADCSGTNAVCMDTIGGLGGFGGTAAPGGYCSGTCSQDSDCGEGGACVGAISLAGLANVKGNCEKTCTKDADCDRSKYYCAAGLQIPGNLPIPGLGGTQPSTCQPRPDTVELPDGVVGKKCSSDKQCGPGTCADRLGGFTYGGQTYGGQTAPGGYCTGPCLQDSDCGENGVCVNLLGGAGGQAGACYLNCDSCTRKDYECGPVARFGGRGGAGGGGASGQIPEACVPVPAAPDAGTMEPDAGHGPDAGHENDAGGDPLDAGRQDAALPDAAQTDASSASGDAGN
jgi:hypothetical protein